MPTKSTASGIDPLAELQQLIQYWFLNSSLLEKAMRHSTALEGQATKDNRRLEFLGDAVIELVMRASLYAKGDFDRGFLSAEVDKEVRDGRLAERAARIGLQDALTTGKGEALNDGGKTTRLAGAFEALAGAIFLDAGAEHAFRVVGRMMGAAERKDP